MALSKISSIISICGFIGVLVLVLGAILISNSNERVERAHEATQESMTDFDNTIRSQIQKCVAKNGYDECVGVVLGYKLNGCEEQEVYKDLPVCNDGTLDEYLQVHDKGLEEFITEGPVVAMALQGVHAVEIVRKITGDTEPKKSLPGTIRGDYAHHSYEYADKKGISVKNIIHASGTVKEAKTEIDLWFKEEELHDYETVHEVHTM